MCNTWHIVIFHGYLNAYGRWCWLIFSQYMVGHWSVWTYITLTKIGLQLRYRNSVNFMHVDFCTVAYWGVIAWPFIVRTAIDQFRDEQEQLQVPLKADWSNRLQVSLQSMLCSAQRSLAMWGETCWELLSPFMASLPSFCAYAQLQNPEYATASAFQE